MSTETETETIKQKTAVIEPESISQLSGAQRVDDKVRELLHQIEAGHHDGKSFAQRIAFYIIMMAAFVVGGIVGNPSLLPGVA